MNIFGNYGDISGNTDRLYEFTARLNRAYDKAVTLITSADGRWQWDDTNYTDLPIGSTALVSGQRDYAFDLEHLDVIKVVITDSSGNKRQLTPYSLTDAMGQIEAEDITTAGGVPEFYRKTGGSIMLHPTPNYSRSLALTVYYQRRPSYFAYTDATKSPGLPYTLHRYLSLEASLDYAISKQLDLKKDLAVEVKAMEDTLINFYSKRAKDESKFIRPVYRSSR